MAKKIKSDASGNDIKEVIRHKVETMITEAGLDIESATEAVTEWLDDISSDNSTDDEFVTLSSVR